MLLFFCRKRKVRTREIDNPKLFKQKEVGKPHHGKRGGGRCGPDTSVVGTAAVGGESKKQDEAYAKFLHVW